MILFDTFINGQPRKGIAQAGRTGWVYILDRTDGKPLIGIDERPVPQEPRQKTAKTQPYPIGDAIVPQCAQPLEGYAKASCIFEVFWEEPVLIQPSGIGGTYWSPMSHNPDTGVVPGESNQSARTCQKWPFEPERNALGWLNNFGARASRRAQLRVPPA